MGSGGNLEFTHRDAEALGGTELLGVVAKAILRLGNTDGQVTESILTQFSELALRRRREIDAIGMIDLCGDSLYLDRKDGNGRARGGRFCERPLTRKLGIFSG